MTSGSFFANFAPITNDRWIPANDRVKPNSQPSTPAYCLATWRRNSAGRNDAEKDFIKKMSFYLRFIENTLHLLPY